MSYSTQLAERKAGPVRTDDRYLCLDVLRGVAILGILVMNVYGFAMPMAAYGNPLLMGGTEPYNLGTWIVTHIVADQKFYSIFSMLFGAGLVLMMQRAEARGASFGAIYYRRSFWLLVIGLLHAYLVWFGDILFFYALIGMVVYLFRRMSAERLIVTACLLMLIPPLINFGSSFALEHLMEQGIELQQQVGEGNELDEERQQILDQWEKIQPLVFPTDATLAEETDAYTGRYADAFRQRAESVSMMQWQWLPTFALWRIGGLMLLGMALMKLGIVSGERGEGFYKRLALVGYGVGIPLATFSVVDQFDQQFDPIYYFRYGNISNYVGAVFVALGHLALVNLFVKAGVMRGLVDRFSAVGRMALTNYLTHSIVMTMIFYGYGLGLYAAVPRLWQQAFVLGLITVQLFVSPWWLRHYRFGPVEWLWRSLTYGERQPMRQ